ncbi:apolipoprotein L3-like [Pelodytes ibericus]
MIKAEIAPAVKQKIMKQLLDDMQGSIKDTPKDFMAEVRQVLTTEGSSPEKPENDYYFSEDVKVKYKEYEEKIKLCLEKFEDTQTSFLKRLEECIKEMRNIADDVDKFHRAAILTNIAGSSIGIAGGVATIAGLLLSPFTFGASLVVAGVGAGVAAAGGLTGAAASVADNINIKAKCSKVEELVKEVNDQKEKMQEMLSNIDALIEDMRSLLGLQDAEWARLGARGVYCAAEIARLFQLVSVSVSAARGAHMAARGARLAAAVSGVFAALFIAVDIAFVVKSANELNDGAKAEEAEKIREVADMLEEEFTKMQTEAESFKSYKDIIQYECKDISNFESEVSATEHA